MFANVDHECAYVLWKIEFYVCPLFILYYVCQSVYRLIQH